MMRKLSIEYRMILYSVFMVIAVVSLLTYIFINFHEKHIWKEFDIRINAVTSTLAHDLELPVMLADKGTITRMLKGILTVDSVFSVTVYDENMTLLVYMENKIPSLPIKSKKPVKYDIIGETARFEDEMMDYATVLEPEKIGSVEVVFSSLQIEQNIISVVNVIILSTLAIIIVRIISDYLFAKTLTTPISKLVNGALAVAKGDFNAVSEVSGGKEIEILSDSFNKMIKALRERDTEIQFSHNELERSYNELEEYKSALEIKVKERTKELEDSNKMLSASYQKIKEIDRLKSEFLANMSHELRTPLNSIIGFSKVILKGIDGPVTETQASDLTAIHDSGNHLLSLINDVLDLSKIEAGKMQFEFEEVSLSNVIPVITASFQAMLKEKSLKLTSVYNKDELPVIHADLTRVRQVLLNVISNAIKFTDKGEITIDAKLVTKEDILNIKNKSYSYCPKRTFELSDELVMISITDQGVGIRFEHMSKVFTTFQQVDSSSTRKHAGTGLGMSICERIIEVHGGEIWVESTLDVGTTFHIVLPVKKDFKTKTDDIKALTFSKDRSEKLMIAIIDDDIKATNLYKKILIPEGYLVVALHDSLSCVHEVSILKPDIIILDVLMPGKDGWEIIKELKIDHNTKDIPVIFSTIVSDKKTGMSLGASDYITKPIVEEDLLRAIDNLNKTSDQIVVIDDNKKDLDLICKILKNHGYKFKTAVSGFDGIISVRKYKPGLIILDLMMPDIDGFQVISELKKDQETANIPIIIVSAKDLSKEDKKRLKGNIEDILEKGIFTEDELLANIVSSLKRITGRNG